MRRILSLALVAAMAGPAVAGPAVSIASAMAKTHRLVLPIRIKAGFAFVAGQVNGRKGYFMLDTGTPYAVFLNSAGLELPAGREVSRGSVSSGQKIVMSRYGCIDSLSIAGRYAPDALCDLPGGDFGFVARELKLPFLGFVGDELFKPYRVTFDWAAHHVTLVDRTLPVEQGAVTMFRFGRDDRQVPHFTLEAGGIAIAGAMDTGDPGHVNLTQRDADLLRAAGQLTRTQDKDGHARDVLATIVHDGVSLNSADLPVSIGGERSDIMLGFLFLKNYRSTWDYASGSVGLYRYN